MMLVRPKQSQGRYSRVRLGNKELSVVEEFRYLGHVMTADCQDDKDIKKTVQEAKCSWQYLVRKFLFAPAKAKIPLFQVPYPEWPHRQGGCLAFCGCTFDSAEVH